MQFGGKLAVIVLVLYVIACSSSSQLGEGHNWSQYTKDQYIAGCTEKGGSQQLCSCMQVKMQQKYTIDDMRKLQENSNGNQLPPEDAEFMKNAARECMVGNNSSNSAPANTSSPAPAKSDTSDDD